MIKNIKRIILIVILFFILCGIITWFAFNPISRFGYYRFGLTVYSCVPLPIIDLYVYNNGMFGSREKSHYIGQDEFDKFIEKSSKTPHIIIIGTGYHNQVKIDEKIFTDSKYDDMEIILLKTDEAIKVFNNFKKQNENVSAIIHSTC